MKRPALSGTFRDPGTALAVSTVLYAIIEVPFLILWCLQASGNTDIMNTYEYVIILQFVFSDVI
jgi:hypothetical protein